MIRKAICTLVALCLMSGTALAWPISACACTGEKLGPGGAVGAPGPKPQPKPQAPKPAVELTLAEQQLRNVVLQQQLLEVQITNARYDMWIKRLSIAGVVGGALVYGAKALAEWAEVCATDNKGGMWCPQ